MERFREIIYNLKKQAKFDQIKVIRETLIKSMIQADKKQLQINNQIESIFNQYKFNKKTGKLSGFSKAQINNYSRGRLNKKIQEQQEQEQRLQQVYDKLDIIDNIIHDDEQGFILVEQNSIMSQEYDQKPFVTQRNAGIEKVNIFINPQGKTASASLLYETLKKLNNGKIISYIFYIKQIQEGNQFIRGYTITDVYTLTNFGSFLNILQLAKDGKVEAQKHGSDAFNDTAEIKYQIVANMASAVRSTAEDEKKYLKWQQNKFINYGQYIYQNGNNCMDKTIATNQIQFNNEKEFLAQIISKYSTRQEITIKYRLNNEERQETLPSFKINKQMITAYHQKTDHYFNFELREQQYFLHRHINIYDLNNFQIGKPLLIYKDIKQEVLNVEKMENQYCIISFDYETIIDFKHENFLKPYSLSAVYSIGETILKTFYRNDNCTQQFIKYTQDLQNKFSLKNINLIFVYMGYNSSRFDNFLLLKELAKTDCKLDIKFVNNSILSFKYDGKHIGYDLCRQFAKSLSSVCKSFNTTCQKIGDFDHNEVQLSYNKHNNLTEMFGEEMIYEDQIQDNQIIKQDIQMENLKQIMLKQKDEISNIKNKLSEKQYKLFEYNTYDSLSVIELFHIYMAMQNKVNQLVFNENIDLQEFLTSKTIGSYMYSQMKKYWKQQNIQIPDIEDYDTYKLMRETPNAGRTQVYYHLHKGKLIKNVINFESDQLACLIDVVSLYPYIMLNRDYPIGKQIKCSLQKFLQMNTNKIGFFSIRFDQTNLKQKIIPFRGETLDWNYDGEITQYLMNSVDIKLLIKKGVKVEEVDDKGFYFSDTIKGEKLFGLLNYYKDLKNKQDQLKEAKTVQDLVNENKHREIMQKEEQTEQDKEWIKKYNSTNEAEKEMINQWLENYKEQYNEAMREICKLGMNNISGKVIEKIHTEKYALVQQDKALKLYQDNQILNMVGDRFIVKTIKEEEEIYKNKNNRRPFFYGLLIYAYAREHMYETVLEEYNPMYQDTDSAALEYHEFERIKKEKPHLFEVVYDQETKNLINYFQHNKQVQKAFISTGQKIFGNYDPEIYFNKAVFVAPKNYFVFQNNQIIKGKFKSINQERDILITKVQYLAMKHWPQKYLYEYFATQKQKVLKKSGTEFCDILLKNGEAFILSSQLKKGLNSSKQQIQNNNDNKCEIFLEQKMMIKRITLKEKRNEEKIQKQLNQAK